MIPKELADQVRSEVKQLKEVQDQFLQTYKQLCQHYGGAKWPKAEIEMVFHRVREETIPVMEQAGMDPKAIQALCSWVEQLVLKQ
jgi:hypothetical protein